MVVPRGRGLISKSVSWQFVINFLSYFFRFQCFCFVYFVLVWINLRYRYMTVYGRNLDHFWHSEIDSKHKGHLVWSRLEHQSYILIYLNQAVQNEPLTCHWTCHGTSYISVSTAARRYTSNPYIFLHYPIFSYIFLLHVVFFNRF